MFNDQQIFADRLDAGKKLAEALVVFRDQPVVVFGLTRGGIPVAIEVAKFLQADFEPLVIRKIGHPSSPEYAIGAISAGGQMVVNQAEVEALDKKLFAELADRQKEEAAKRVKLFLSGLDLSDLKGKIAIIVDDGIATGLTMMAAIKEIRSRHPEKIIVAVPVAPIDTVEKIRQEADQCVVVNLPEFFLGAVGTYYADFAQVSDQEVIDLIKTYGKKY